MPTHPNFLKPFSKPSEKFLQFIMINRSELNYVQIDTDYGISDIFMNSRHPVRLCRPLFQQVKVLEYKGTFLVEELVDILLSE